MKLIVRSGPDSHEINNPPSSLQELKDTIGSIFKDAPPVYHVETQRKEGDKLVIADEKVYQDLINENAESETLEISVIPPPKEPSEKNSTSANTDKDSRRKKKVRNSTPALISNKEEFAEELQHVEEDHIINRLENGEAPSDESLPSSMEDHQEKVQEIDETVKEIKEECGTELKPRILTEPNNEQEPPVGKKVKPNSDVDVQVANGKENGNGQV